MSHCDKKPTPGLPSAVVTTSLLFYYLFVRPQLFKWGTRLGESQRRLPGDDLIPSPNSQMTHAINIDAPPEALWPWLAQMGRERTGYYGLDFLDNAGIPSMTTIRQDLPPLAPGMELDGGFQVLEFEPNRKFLFGGFNLQQPPGTTYDLSVLFLLERRRDGSTRLLTRKRAYYYGLAGAIQNYLIVPEVLRFISSRQQLQRLKAYAESMAHLHAATS